MVAFDDLLRRSCLGTESPKMRYGRKLDEMSFVVLEDILVVVIKKLWEILFYRPSNQ